MLVTQFVTQTVNNHFNLHINLHFVFNNVDVYAIISTCLQGGYSMKKRIIIAIGLTVALSMTGCASKEITQTKTETTVELGSECTIIPTDYFELGSKVNPDTIAVDTSAVDTNTVGEYVAVVTYNDSTYEIKVSVSDTTAPEISAKTDITPVDRGTTIYPADYVEVNDLSEVAVYFVAEDGDNESLEIPSDLDNDVTEINYTVVAVDAESNRSEELSVAIPIFTFKQGDNILEPTVDMNSTEVDSNAQDADVKISEEPETTEEPEQTEDAKSSSNPFSGMTYDELGAIDTTNFTDADWNNYLTACQEAEAALAKNKPATEKQPWTGKPFEEMTQEELNAIDDETYYNLPKEDQDRWLKRYDETIVEKGAEFDKQNQSSTGTPVPTGEQHREIEVEIGPITPDGWLCY